MESRFIIHELADLVLAVKSEGKIASLSIDRNGVYLHVFTKDFNCIKTICAWGFDKNYEAKLNEMLDYLKGVEK